jgi:hypothetical protein
MAKGELTLLLPKLCRQFSQRGQKAARGAGGHDLAELQDLHVLEPFVQSFEGNCVAPGG